MKRFFFLLLVLSSVLLCACGKSPAPQVPAVSPAPADSAVSGLLDRIRDGVQPGSAGASLKAASVAADLLDWAAGSPQRGAADAAVSVWLEAQTPEARAQLPEQIGALRSAVERLAADFEGSAGLLSDAGLEGRGPWDESAAELALALLDTLERDAK